VRVFDTLMFHSELDILEARLTELEDLDVTHVLVEATVNHSRGDPKPLYYADNKSRFDRWNDRIVHVIADDLPSGPDYWAREHAQRERAWKGLADAGPDDVIIHSDCDELLSENAIRLAQNLGDAEGYHLPMREFIYAVDWEIPGIRVAAMTRLRDLGGFMALRTRPLPDPPAEAGPMGWHLSSFGGPEGIEAKLERHCHPELEASCRAYLAEGRMWEKGEFPFREGKATPVEVDETWPRYVTSGRAPRVWFRPR
jgi:Glycosyltransferase family 17